MKAPQNIRISFNFLFLKYFEQIFLKQALLLSKSDFLYLESNQFTDQVKSNTLVHLNKACFHEPFKLRPSNL